MKLPLAGPTYIDDYDVNFQRCVNYYPVLSGPDGSGNTIVNPNDTRQEATAVLRPTPGKKLMVDLGTGVPIRAIIDHNDTIYAVSGSGLYKLTINDIAGTASASLVGTIAGGNGLVKWAINPTQIMLTDGNLTGGYVHTVATDVTTQITDAQYLGASQVIFIDTYFVYNPPNAGTIAQSAINDGTSYDALDVATEETSADLTVGLASYNGEIWVFSSKGISVWFDAANPTGLSFSKRPGAYINQGCAAANSILNFNNTLMWLDDRRYIVMAREYTSQKVSTAAIDKAIQKYETVSDAYAWKEQAADGQFYCISFPSEEKTWVYDATSELWHERAYYSDNQTLVHDLTHCAVRYKSRWDLLGSRLDGKIYISDTNTLLDGTRDIYRIRAMNSKTLNREMTTIDMAQLICSTGTANPTGNGSDPYVMLRYTIDGGRNWSHEMVRSLGSNGEYNKEITWNRLGAARRWGFELHVMDPFDHVLCEFNVYGTTERGKIL